MLANATEIKHAQNLLLMEEEAKIRRRKQAKRVSYEHCLQRKHKEDILKKLEEASRDAEIQVTHKIHQLEMCLAGIKAQIHVIEECLEKRKKDLQLCHDSQVNRFKSYLKGLQEEIGEVKGKELEADDLLEQLQSPRDATRVHTIRDLEDELKARKEESRARCQHILREAQEQMRHNEESLPRDEDLINLEEELEKAEHESRRTQKQQHDDINEIIYEIDMIQKTTSSLKTKDTQAMEARLKDEVRVLNDELVLCQQLVDLRAKRLETKEAISQDVAREKEQQMSDSENSTTKIDQRKILHILQARPSLGRLADKIKSKGPHPTFGENSRYEGRNLTRCSTSIPTMKKGKKARKKAKQDEDEAN